MSKEFEDLMQLLKEEIQSKFGKKILYATDCQALSEQIQYITKRQVSVSTLKRFFGVIHSPVSPSKYTMDTLAMFLQFADWQDFIDNFENEKHLFSREESWGSLGRRTRLITNISLKSIKHKVGSLLDYFPSRKTLDRSFEAFLCSSKTATALIAPEGYGKSTVVVQLTEKYFTGPDAMFPNDTVCLVDGSILYNLLTHNKKVNRLYNLIEYNPLKSFSVVFRNNPDLVKGRFVLIIDGVDEIYPEIERTYYFIDNLLKMISSYENIHWYKILITCTPSKWRMFLTRIQKNPQLKLLWFNVPFQGTDDDLTNIPLLRRKEIDLILKKNHFSQDLNDLCFNHPDVLEIINHPYFLNLFLTTYKHKAIVKDIDLLNQYIKDTVLSPPFLNEKFSIIKSFFNLCDYGLKSSEVKKEDLNLPSSATIVYNELIQSGILHEYSIADSYLSLNTYVKFSHNILFAYYLANMLARENLQNDNFVQDVIEKYSQSPVLQCNLVKYIIKILFRDENTEILKNIFSVFDQQINPENNYNLQELCTIITSVVSIEMRKSRKMREILVPWYAKSPIGSTLFFEKYFDIDSLILHSGNDLGYYLQYNQSNRAKQYVCYMRFMMHFLNGNQEQCKTEYENSLNLKVQVSEDSLNSSYYFIPQIIYQSVYEKKLDENIIREVYRVAEALMQSGIQQRTDIPQFEFAIIYSLYYGKMNQEIIDLARYVFEKYDLTDLELSCFYQFFLSIYAIALLETGEVQKALEFYDQLKYKNINIPELMKNYVKIRLLLIKAEFLIYKGKLKKAQKLLEQIKSISQMLRSSYFYGNALELEKNILALS